MSKKILKILNKISQDMQDTDFDPKELLDTITYDDEDLMVVRNEIEEFEFSDTFDDDVLDILKALLVYLLMRDSSYEQEYIYALIFGGGKNIVWN